MFFIYLSFIIIKCNNRMSLKSSKKSDFRVVMKTRIMMMIFLTMKSSSML